MKLTPCPVGRGDLGCYGTVMLVLSPLFVIVKVPAPVLAE
jgi:hypothetical protein